MYLPPPRSTLFPYTTLFRSLHGVIADPLLQGRPADLIDAEKVYVEGCAVEVGGTRSEEHTSELQSPYDIVCRLLLEKKKKKMIKLTSTCKYLSDIQIA